MVAGNTEEAALGSARGRFLEGLPRKAIELRGAVALLSATPAAAGPRDDMLRRLNALYASALVFRNEALAQALHECIDRLDAARETRRPIDPADLELLARLVHRLPELRDEPAAREDAHDVLREGAAGARLDALREGARDPSDARQRDEQRGVRQGESDSASDSAGLSRRVDGVDAAPLDAVAPPQARSGSAPRRGSAAPTQSAARDGSERAGSHGAHGSSSHAAPRGSEAESTHAAPRASETASTHAAPGASEAASTRTTARASKGEPTRAAALESAAEWLEASQAGRDRAAAYGDAVRDRGEHVDSSRESGEHDSRRREERTVVGLADSAGGELHSAAQASGALRAELPTTSTAASGQPLLQRVLHVLLLSARAEQTELIDLLRSESLRVSSVSSVADLVVSVRADAPDLVLANERIARDGNLLEELRAEASTDFIPVVTFEAAEAALYPPVVGSDFRVPRPFDGDQLMHAIGSATGTLIAPYRPAELGTVTLGELAQRVAEEVRRGLVDAASQGRGERVSLQAGADVMAASYAAVSELRAAVVRASAGRVKFAARPADRGPALVALGAVDEYAESAQRLFGRRVVLVEDDTAIVLLLANLLRAEGATVHEGTDGQQALAAARRERPDLVIAGARLPHLDAFALCRELAREPLLADVPVLLLPAKEQLLTRPKEQGSAVQLARELSLQVVASAVTLLKPRSDIEERLKRPGEVRGTLDGTGVLALLRSVRRTRPDVRICLRDAWNLFECELRDGRLAQITRTACDGSFVRNERALPQLIGTRAGRFAVSDADTPMKVSFEGTLDEVLTRAARELAAQLDAVSGARLGRVARVLFDEDAYALLVEETPRPIRSVLERLYAGEPPRKLIKTGAIAAELLEPLLLDMARRGALRAVVGSAGEDLVAEAAQARASDLPTDLSSPLSMVPPPPRPVISMLPSHDAFTDSTARVEARTLAAGNVTAAAAAAANATLPMAVAATTSGPTGAALGSAPPDPRSAAAIARGREASLSDASEIAAASAEARRSRSTLAAWTVALLALGAVAFFVAREPAGSHLPVEALGSQSPRRGQPSGAAQEPARARAPSPGMSAAFVTEVDGFAVYEGLLDAGIAVPREQALLIVEATPALTGATVWLNDRELGAPPQQLALPEGVHELAIKRGDAMSYRFVSVHRGKTWVLRNP